MTHNYTKLGAKQNMNWDSTRIVLNWIRLSTLSAWIYTVFPSMLHTLIFTSTQLWSKFTRLPLPDLSCLSHSCTPGFLRMLTWGQWLSPWRLILQAIVLAVRPKLWNRPAITFQNINVRGPSWKKHCLFLFSCIFVLLNFSVCLTFSLFMFLLYLIICIKH